MRIQSIVLLFLLWSGGSAIAAGLTVLPGTTVNVGQEIYFDANDVTVPGATLMANGMIEGYYEWDWGDTTTSKRFDYSTTFYQGGNPIIHVFMRPGTFHVAATVTETGATPDSNTASVDITVTGDWPELPPLPATLETLWLKLNDDLLDSSGNGLNGSAVGSPTYSTGAQNNGLTVSTGNYTQVADNDLLEGMSALTVTLWAKKNAKTDSGYLIQKAGSYYIRLQNATTIWGAIFAGGTAKYNSQSSLGPIDNTWWHYYALTYDGSTIRTYLDGAEIDLTPESITGTVTANTAALKIGESFSGTIDEVKVFRACLTQDELIRRFELRHAPIRVRTEQYIQVSVPGRYTTDVTNTMGLTVTGAVTGLTTLRSQTSSIAPTTNVLMNNTALGIDSYTLTATLKNAGGTTLTAVSDYFSKSYAGAPTVGFDRNNSIVFKGAKFFPLTTWILREDLFPHYDANDAINTAMGSPTSPSYTLAVWQAYVDAITTAYGVGVIGSSNWVYGSVAPYWRNFDIGYAITPEVNAMKSDVDLLSYHIGDEPDIQGENGHIPAAVLAALRFKTDLLDPQHPLATNYAGPYIIAGYMTTGDYRSKEYAIQYNANYFGGRGTPPADLIGMDYYPVDLGTGTPTGVANYATILDRMRDRSYGLIPYSAYVEVADVQATPATPSPTPAQIKMLSWLGVVHGCKMTNWFHYFSPTYPTAANFAAMRQFVTDITALKDIILGPAVATTVTDTADETGNRVDTLVRSFGGKLWIVAVRVTEIGEAGTLTPTFTIHPVSEGYAVTGAVYDEARSISLTGLTFSDSFAQDEVHIYEIDEVVPSAPVGPYYIWDSL